MKSRVFRKRKVASDLPLPYNYIEITGEEELIKGDLIFLFDHNDNRWYFDELVMALAGQTPNECTQRHANVMRFARQK
jgi:hypothetical protein